MHQFDPNGAIHAYRMERNRRGNIFGILFGIGFVCFLFLIVCGVFITLSLAGK